jgi:cell division protein FtsN
MAQDNRRGARGTGGTTRHPMMIGVFMGVLLGLCAALALALYLFKASPFVAKDKDSGTAKPVARAEIPKGPPAGLPTQPPTVAMAPSSGAGSTATPAGTKPGDAKQRFDFYTILPGKNEPKAEQTPNASDSGPQREVIYLQAGAFQKSSDADNLKARLALSGLEAQIQTATLSDSSVWHRVRLGPYATPEELNRARAVLRENKIEPSIIKLSERDPKR